MSAVSEPDRSQFFDEVDEVTKAAKLGAMATITERGPRVRIVQWSWEGEKTRVWDVLDYDPARFWRQGPTDPNFQPVRITPTRVELSKSGSPDKRVWRA